MITHTRYTRARKTVLLCASKMHIGIMNTLIYVSVYMFLSLPMHVGFCFHGQPIAGHCNESPSILARFDLIWEICIPALG